MAYLLGQGVTQDKHKALQLLGEASKEGRAEAQYNLALMYYMGDGVEQNVTKTAQLLERSAKQNYKKAIANVGRIYMQILDFDKAIYWLSINAKNGDTQAEYLLAELYVEKGDFKNAKTHAQKAMNNGNLDAKQLYNDYNLSSY
jgi:TPR repeat protein